jgi:hypothetical protein
MKLIALVIILIIILLVWGRDSFIMKKSEWRERPTIVPRVYTYVGLVSTFTVVDLTNSRDKNWEKYKWADVVLDRRFVSDDDIIGTKGAQQIRTFDEQPTQIKREILSERGWVWVKEGLRLSSDDIVGLERKLMTGINTRKPYWPIDQEIELIRRGDQPLDEVLTTYRKPHPSQSDDCQDTAKNCQELLKQDMCYRDPQMMHKKCPHTCGTCGYSPDDLLSITDECYHEENYIKDNRFLI